MKAKSGARHARPGGMSHRPERQPSELPRTWHLGPPVSAAGRGRVHGDPLTGPIVITERPVLGDEMRRPIVWCEITPCIGRYEDRAALGEADVRARAIGAGWRYDGGGRLACPACQQRCPDLWPVYPVVPWAGTLADDHRQRQDPVTADVAGGLLSSIVSQARGFGAGWRATLGRLLHASLTAGGRDQDTSRSIVASNPAGRESRAGPAGHRRSRRRTPAISPAGRGGDDGSQDG